MGIKKIIQGLKVFSLPIILFSTFVLFRLLGLQPSMEGELGDFLTSVNFMLGSFFSYLVFILIVKNGSIMRKPSGSWWWCMSMLLALLAFDELFMIHEYLGELFNIKDTLILLFYGGLLGVLLLLNTQEVFKKNTFVSLTLFAVFSIISQGADYFLNEGLVTVAGIQVSYEQLSESLGALCLTVAITTIITRHMSMKAPETTSNKK